MSKPVILTVDDNEDVLNAIARDLRREYAASYRIARASSGASALEAVEQFSARGERIALLLVDQRMPEMSGVEFLSRAIQVVPTAKRALLTAYADTEAAIRAINEIGLDHYLMKPWEPPEEHLYPVLHDLLDAWHAENPPPFEGVRVIGHRWSSATHATKDFLARNLVPYRFVDVEQDPEALEVLAHAGANPHTLPVVLFPDGSHLVQPAPPAVAERLGLRTRATLPFYDLVIVGGGPAGLAAAVYGTSEGLRTLLIEGEAPGGQAGTSSRIENYLGFPAGLSGGDLTRRAVAQASRFGAEILTPVRATGLRVEDAYRFVSLSDGSEVSCQVLLIASGVSYRRLDVPGADRFEGAGLFYGAAITEAMSCAGKDVYVVGGGNSAGQGAMYLSRFARCVTVVIRGESLKSSMSSYLIDQIAATDNISVLPHCQVAGIRGDATVRSVDLRFRDGREEEVAADALFVFIGAMPHTDWLAGVVQRDERGFIPTGADLLQGGRRPEGWTLQRDPYWLESSVPGVFVAGDVRMGSVKRVASAVGEGSMAVQFAHHYLASL